MREIEKCLNKEQAKLMGEPEVLFTRSFIWNELQQMGEPAPYGLHFRGKNVFVCSPRLVGTPFGYLSPKEKLICFKKAVLRLVEVESCDFYHGDLKSEHIFIDINGLVHWLDWDFAISQEAGRKALWGIGTSEYLAPEKRELGITNAVTEIYSLGKILLPLSIDIQNTKLISLAQKSIETNPELRPLSLQIFSECLEAAF